MKIDWKRKLASRKFWAALAALAGAVAVVIGVDDGGVAAIGAIISAAGVLVAYILGESYVDAAGAAANSDTQAASTASAEPAKPTSSAFAPDGDTCIGADSAGVNATDTDTYNVTGDGVEDNGVFTGIGSGSNDRTVTDDDSVAG